MTQEAPSGENNLVANVAVAQELAAIEDQGYDQAQKLGIRDQASLTVEAHGQRFSVAAALVECPPFANALRAVAEATQSLPEDMRRSVLASTVSNMATTAATAKVPEAVTETTVRIATTNQEVKKN